MLDTLEYLVHETRVWVEITTLLIPGRNDSEAELHEMTSWIVEHLGPDVPLHFSAFHPDYRMLDVPPTPPSTLVRARAIARANGVRYAYTGNVHDVDGGSTYCPTCSELVVERDWYELGAYRLTDDGVCVSCGTRIPGVFDGPAGRWGSRRHPVRLRDFPASAPTLEIASDQPLTDLPGSGSRSTTPNRPTSPAPRSHPPRIRAVQVVSPIRLRAPATRGR